MKYSLYIKNLNTFSKKARSCQPCYSLVYKLLHIISTDLLVKADRIQQSTNTGQKFKVALKSYLCLIYKA